MTIWNAAARWFVRHFKELDFVGFCTFVVLIFGLAALGMWLRI